jgi:hypothetical protein
MCSINSLYSNDEYTRVYCFAIMISTHSKIIITPDAKSVRDREYEVVSSAFEHYLAPALPDPATHKLYFDHGSETLDAVYARYQDRVDAVVRRRGYRQWSNVLSLSFPGEKHNEISWASRVAVPLQFLLPPLSAP